MESVHFRFSLFQPELSRRHDIAQYYYYIPSIQYMDPDPEEKDYYRNCAEWQAFTGKGVSLKDIYNVQYEMSPCDLILPWQGLNMKWSQWDNNSFIKWLRLPANQAAMDYMIFAKKVELGQILYDPWVPETGTQDEEQHIRTANAKCRDNTSPFLRQRYAFQLVKLHYYSKKMDKKALIAAYDTYLKGKKSFVADMGLLYYAGAHSDTAYTRLMLDAADRCQSKKDVVFTRLGHKDLNALDAVNKDKHMEALILQMRALKQPDRSLSTLKRLYNIDPDNPYLPLLLCREVNKLEDWISTPTMLGFYPQIKQKMFENAKEERRGESYYSSAEANKIDTSYGYYAATNLEKDKAYMRTVRDFLIDIQQRPRTANKDMISLAIAHLYNMEGQYAAAEKYTAKIKAIKDRVFLRQAITENLIATMYGKDLKQAETKQAIYKQFQALSKVGDTLVGGIGAHEYNTWDCQDKDMRAGLLLMLGRRYAEIGDNVTAGLLIQQSKVELNEYMGHTYDKVPTEAVSYNKIAWFDKHATPEDVERLLAFRHQTVKTPFEKMLVPDAWGPDDLYRDLQGTLLIRQHRFKEAAAVMNKIADRFWEKNYQYSGYLTRIYIGSPGGLVPGEETKQRYAIASKKKIINDIVALEDSIGKTTNPQVLSTLHYKMGNVLFNISFHGRSWMMSSYGRSYNEYFLDDQDNYKWASFSFYPNQNIAQSDYYTCNRAMQSYQTALQQPGAPKELRAKILLMMNVCDKERYDFRALNSDKKNNIYQWKEPKPYENPYLKLLKEKYSKTETFADARSMCPDVDKYLKH